MSEGVEILISADDQASAKFAQVANAAENNVKQIKEVGGKAKASTEFVGQLAGAFGNSQIAGFAGQLAGLTEKVGQFSEVSKAGGAGAMIFKGGLVAATAFVAFNVGKYIGDWAFETKKWADELEHAKNKMGEIDKKMLDIQQKKFGQARDIIGATDDPEEKKKAIEAQVAALGKQLEQEQISVENAKAALKLAEEQQAWNYIGNDIVESNVELQKQQLKVAEEKRAATSSEQQALEEMIGAHAQELEAIKASGAAKLQWQTLVAEEQKRTVDERIKEAELAQKEYEDELKNIELLKKADEDRAAKDKENQLAMQRDQEKQRQAEQEKAEELARRMGEATTNTASESRLLTRGPSQDKTVEVATNTAKANELLAEIPQLIATALAAILPKSKAIQIEKVN